MARILGLAFPSNIRPALGQRRKWRENIAALAAPITGAIQITKAKDITITFLRSRAVDSIFSKNHFIESVYCST